ncbi:MAG: hypothetical protein KKF46_05525 [Nanoarchaeota archaeon]|nr:hypothetical protein [Nanoarchaeota archaeon]MBU1321792.1 hypothetical protein [Nanoarchaeota archaeon]MBU1598198.1 hypothetical protein [Nanoarchaeota archaeon]MBU2441667.1 hypothetical protein [Nanoarchaeota archaeon]
MKESLQEARDELKRVDHQIYVSLKYTRTVDVLMNTLGRMIDAYNCLMDSLLKLAVEKNRIKEEYIPNTPLEKGNMVKDLYPDDIVQKNIALYFLFRKIVKTNPKKEQEFRRHVTLRTIIDNEKVFINIDNATEYYHMIKEFYNWVEAKINEEEVTS